MMEQLDAIIARLKKTYHQLDSLLSRLKTAYHQQGRRGKILFAGIPLLMFSLLFTMLFRMSQARDSPPVLPSPMIGPGAGIIVTPTGLFYLDMVTSPTIPTGTQPPTENPTPVQTLLPGAGTSVATATGVSAANEDPVIIRGVDKLNEFVDIENIGAEPVNLTGWILVSEEDNQPCSLSGVLQPNERLRVWSRTKMSNRGFSCRYTQNIWDNNGPDPAVLYDPQGQEVSRYP